MNEFDPDREARKVLWATLIFATVCSLAANITHSIRIHHGGWAAVGPVLFAMLAPVALLILFHLLGVWARRAGYRSITYWVFLAAILGLGAAAFRLSFAAIRDLAMGWGYGYGDAALFPLILDGLIAVCTVGLVATQRPKVVLRSEAADRSVEHPAPALLTERFLKVDRPAAAPVHRPDPHETPIEYRPRTAPVERVTDRAVDRAPVGVIQPDPPLVPEDLDRQVEHALSWEDTDTGPLQVQAVEQPAAVMDQEPEAETDQSKDRTEDQAAERSETRVDRDPQLVPGPVNHRPLSLVHQPTDRPVDHRALAERVVARTAGDWTVDQLELVSRSTPGRGQRALAEELGLSATTVNRMRKSLVEAATEIA